MDIGNTSFVEFTSNVLHYTRGISVLQLTRKNTDYEIDTYGEVTNRTYRTFRLVSVAAFLQMPPLWGLGLGLIHVSTQMPPLRGSRGFWHIYGLWIEPCAVTNRTIVNLGIFRGIL